MTFIHKHKAIIPLICFSLTLIAVRFLVAQNFNFIFLFWNLFLALIPLVFSHKLTGSATKSSAQQYCWAALWLLFFPNSVYIITDIFHFYERPPIAKWYDLILLFSSALNGMIAGFISLLEVEKWLKGKVKQRFVQPVLAFVLLLSSFGIYLGRYLRFNSWDIVAHPFRLGRGIFAHIIYPQQYAQSWLLSLVFGLWFYLIYSGIKRMLVYEKNV